MYAAKRVDNVQAVSEQKAAEEFTVYFVVPNTMPGNNETVTVLDSDEIKFNVRTDRKPGNSKNDEWWLQLSMEPTGWKTEDGHKIYAVKNCKDILGDNILEIQFQLYRDGGWKAQIPLKEQEPKPISSYNNKMYDPTKGEWTDNPILTGHTYYKNKPIKFENRSTAELTNVKANFYIPDKDGALTLVNSSEAQTVAGGGVVGFTIPDQACSYVQFTWGEDGHSKFYNFYNESVSGNDKESFLYSETSNCFIYTGTDNVRWGKENSFRIYYDATFSKMALTGDTDDYSIPKANQSTVYYRLKGDGKESIGGTMSRIEGTDYYAADVPDGYTEIVFSSYPLSDDKNLANCGNSTGWETIPTDYKVTERCFYADTNDDAVYGKGQRGGYWAPKGTPRDAEKGKDTGTKVVDIKPADFTEKADTKYVTSTLYDYYTDYELNGKNRGSYDQSSPAVSYRNWVPFREFDQALSDYYQAADAKYPLYTGHFQPSYSDWGYRFDAISAALNLWGLNNDFKDENRFMAINNSTINEEGKGTRYDYAYQGLVADTTSTGKATGEPLLKGTTKAEPHFDEAFLSGTNTKNAKLGNVYNNVAFPFTKKAIFDEDQGVDYWYFDSQDTTLYLKQDTEQDQYFLKSSTDEQEREKSRNLESNSTSKTITKNDKTVSSYGYFPFNETATSGVASTYNYGFGTKLQMDFTLTDDGMVETNKTGEDGKKEKTSIKFFFSGDDDVWVFIDGKLALDVGGAHGKVSGLLEFGETNTKDGKKNSVTAYVSRVKTGGTSDKDKDEKNDKPVKTVTYNGEKISFYKESIPLVAKDTPLVLDKGKKHTLTMYYMERGMWESNMAVAFNFPDNNELQVQKEVDLTNVTDDDFKNCFKNQKIFNFTIQNQATHYGTTLAAIPNPSDTKKVNLTAEGNTIEPATPGKKDDYIFELVKNPWPDSKPDSGQDPGQDTGQNTEQVLHWYARYMDTQSAAREKRRGILKLENPINIKDMRFLTFQVYVDTTDGSEGDLSLNNLYVELLDDKDVQKGSLDTSGINGATYGSVEVTTDQWVTVKLDLHKMKERDGFSDNVKTIRVGDNYNRNIYFRNFTFIPKAVPSKVTGFTTDQEKIPDYGSAESGHLENAENAQYTSSNDTDTQLVDKDGRFVLEAGETVTFSDQFRRGSYISLKEELNQNLYDTTWTVCENGHVVESMKEGNSVTLPSTIPSLDGQTGSSPNDGRTEKKGADKEQEGNKYNENKPSADTIVFRSYKDPDETSSTLTKLKVKYVNTVKTGGLKIQKQAAEGETLTGTYTFKVTFNDVGGEGLEEKPIERTVTIDMGKGESTGTITGIPVGTRYTIEEVKTDDSRLQSVTVPKGQSAQVIYNTMVEGEIVASKNPDNPNDPKDLEVTAIFTNTKRKLINIEFDKLWKDANNEDIVTTNQPDEIYIQLQRRLANSAEDAPWDVVDYPTSGSKYVTVHHTDNGWLYPFNNLDQYPVGGSAANNYIYRIVEGTVDEAGNFTAADGTITIKGNTYVVTAKATPKSEKDSETGATTTPATATDGTITGGSGKIVLTNKLQNPKFVLDIIKKDAEPNNAGEEVFLKDVEFKLEKLKAETITEGKTQWVVDKDYQFDSTKTDSITGTTGMDGKIISNPFKNLEPGTYRLTETKAHPEYNLLAQPIEIKFTQDGKCYIDDVEVKKDDKTFIPGANNTYTMTLTVLNRKTPELPHTGADAPSLWLLIGMPLAVAGLLIFTFRYNRKGGRRH
ncbi:SpaA isopeptide-forming pilin-related protein [Gemmiger sp.]|uniref:SpaA isopeptide-forming pilin-related protein n=1 Tax=Gemmiger sp. TaxID=2049027 RepID=UPI0025C32DFC|nr:SpaA isopeptide-forming pilin-related protein [Gemmiger sp.]